MGRQFIKNFINDNFLLENSVAEELYHRYAEPLPILDYHNHLSPKMIAEDHRFSSLTEIWLSDDHYKWRAMRANGVAERYCTGKDTSDWEKFEAWAATMPKTLRNPLYHWTHMELRRPFGIDVLLDSRMGREIYDKAGQLLSQPGFSTLGLLEKFKVAVVCTTDDPVDSLEHHEWLALKKDPATRVYPTWRPDKALAVEDPKAWNDWVGQLETVSDIAVGSLNSFLEALEKRHGFFHDQGCRSSDHGLECAHSEPFTDQEASTAFNRLRSGGGLEPDKALDLKSYLLYHLALLDHSRGWVQQFHLGALRDNSSRLRTQAGLNIGADSIGDFPQAQTLSRFLDRLDSSNQLAKTILFNLNPADNEVFAAMCGNFQDGSTPGKVQWGPAWWFLDQKDGMEAHLRVLSNLGLLSRFVGMTTDSRSFLSFSRHDYFRRLVCNLLGQDVEKGLVPDDRELLGKLAQDTCFFNAVDYFNVPLGHAAAGFTRVP